jgi:hypothetical protein
MALYSGAIQQKVRVFQLQKKITRIITWSETRTSCKPLLESQETLTLPSQHILSLIKFLAHNFEIYVFNFTVHGINKRYKLQLYTPTTYLILYQKGAYYMCIQIFNEIPEYIHLRISNWQTKSFTTTLKKYLVNKSWYSLEEFFMIEQLYKMNPDDVYVRMDF